MGLRNIDFESWQNCNYFSIRCCALLQLSLPQPVKQVYSSQCPGFFSLYLLLLSPGSRTYVAFVRWFHEFDSEFCVKILQQKYFVEILSYCRSFWAVMKKNNCTSYTDIWNMSYLLPGVLKPLTNLHNNPEGSKRFVATRSQSS